MSNAPKATLRLALQLLAPAVFVFDPRPLNEDPATFPPGVVDKPAAGPLIFTSWPQLVACIGSMTQTVQATILIPAPCAIPAGVWDLRGAQIVGVDAQQFGGDATPLQGQIITALAEGCQLQQVRGISNMAIEVGSTGTPVITWDDVSRIRGLTLTNCTVRMMAVGGVFVTCSGTEVHRLIMHSARVERDDLLASNAAVTFARHTAGTATIGILALESGSSIEADTIASTTANRIQLAADAEALIQAQPRMNTTGPGILHFYPAAYTSPAVLVIEQVTFDAAERGQVRQAWAMSPATGGPNVIAGDTFTITDGTTSETWTAVAGVPAAFQFQVGVGVLESTGNLCSAIASDSTLWTTAHGDGLSVGNGTDPACVIMRKVQTRTAYPDRCFGTMAATITVHEFAKGCAYQTYAPPPGGQGWPISRALAAADPGIPIAGWGAPFVPIGFILGIVNRGPSVVGRVDGSNDGSVAGTFTLSDGYTPDDPLVWTAPLPTTQTEAIDRMAQAVAGLLAGPIP